MVKKPEYRDLFPGALELMILKTLSRKPMHGYALAQRIKEISDDLLQIEEGSLYPALQRMLKAGWLESEMGLSARNRPVRIFKLTQAGRKHLEQEISSVEQMFAGISRVLALARHRRFIRCSNSYSTRRRRYDELSETIREHLEEKIADADG